MNILGLHFGHDAGVSILRDGKIAAYVLRERHVRTKHAISLNFTNIQTAMQAAGLEWDQIDYCAITSTQDIELIIDDAEKFSFKFDTEARSGVPCGLLELVKAQNIDPASLLGGSLMNILYEPNPNTIQFQTYGHAFTEWRNRQPADFTRFGCLDRHLASSLWTGMSLDQIAGADFSPTLRDDALRFGGHFPVTVHLAGRSIPGYYIAHHMAHAAASFYQSGFDHAAIFSHDGFADGAGCLSGMFFWAKDNRIYPLTPHHLAIGSLYHRIGVALGLDAVGAPGKLMGLAAYGQPRFFDRSFVGNQFDWNQRGIGIEQWMQHCLLSAKEMGYDLDPLGKRDRVTEGASVDIAASTQKLFEETYLLAVETLHKLLARMGRRTPNLCLTGGCALNCPTNSRIFREGPFSRIFVEPSCDDSGLALGAASFLYHNVLDQPLPHTAPGVYASPFLGVEVSGDSIQRALQSAGEHVDFTRCQDAAAAAADDLAANKIIGWFESRSEVGPRALGHRSILADARHADNWPRVNELKGREKWRPFAPAVLDSEAANWFIAMPAHSPYMLFTAFVRSNQLPAITHKDGSARVQTVDASCGEFFRVIEQFHKKTGIPLILNTSFNGPGEPIVESPEDALRFLVSSKLDALYMGGFRITRR